MDLIITILPVVTKDHPISPRFTPSCLTIFLSRCKFSTLTTRQPMVEFYLLTFPRFPLRKKEHKSYFGENRTLDFRTSRCAGYLLDHSSDLVYIYGRWAPTHARFTSPTYCNGRCHVLPVVTKHLIFPPRFLLYEILSRCKFKTRTQLTFPRFPLHNGRQSKNPEFVKNQIISQLPHYIYSVMYEVTTTTPSTRATYIISLM